MGLAMVTGVVTSLVLCFQFGVLLETWLHGKIKNGYRAFGFGFLILIMNTFISFAGCGVLMAFTGS